MTKSEIHLAEKALAYKKKKNRSRTGRTPGAVTTKTAGVIEKPKY